MKKLFLAMSAWFILAGCNTTNDSKELAELQAQVAQLKDVQSQVAIKVGLAELVRPDKIELSKEAVKIGSDSTSIVMLEYTDLHCPYCKKFQFETWPSLKEQFVDTDQVQVLARELPLSNIHPKAPYAAVMLRCANNQGKYESVKNRLFEIGGQITQDDISTVVADNGLDEALLNECLADTKTHNIVTNSINDALKLGLSSTPTFIIGQREGDMLINYKIISGSKSVDEFSDIIEQVKSL